MERKANTLSRGREGNGQSRTHSQEVRDMSRVEMATCG